VFKISVVSNVARDSFCVIDRCRKARLASIPGRVVRFEEYVERMLMLRTLGEMLGGNASFVTLHRDLADEHDITEMKAGKGVVVMVICLLTRRTVRLSNRDTGLRSDNTGPQRRDICSTADAPR